MKKKLAQMPEGFKTIIEAIDKVYPDNMIQLYAMRKVCVCDGLAEFIVDEIGDVFDENAAMEVNLDEAERVMDRAIEELEAVKDAIIKMRPI